jgi:hypothetical protein
VLDEKALRRPGFRDDVRVRLADGQEWALPKPRIRTGRRRNPDGSRSLAYRVESGEAYQRRLDEMYEATGTDFFLAVLDLAGMLLSENYDLTEDQIDEVLSLDFSDSARPEDVAAREAIQHVIQGLSPKGRGDSGDDPG